MIDFSLSSIGQCGINQTLTGLLPSQDLQEIKQFLNGNEFTPTMLSSLPNQEIKECLNQVLQQCSSLDVLKQEYKAQDEPDLTSLQVLVNNQDKIYLHSTKIIQIYKELLKKQKQKNLTSFVNVSKMNIPMYLQNQLEIDIKELQIYEQISQSGGFSILYRGSLYGQEVAVKKIFNPIITPELQEEFSNEVQMAAKIRHPFIVNIIGIVTKPPDLAIIMEYLPNGSLFDYLHKMPKKQELSTELKLQIAIQLAQVLLFMNKQKIVHRDIKTHNILLDKNMNIKLCDFGLARNFDDLNIGSAKFCGTPSYMALELFEKSAYDYKIDIFAYGTVLWEIYSRKIPFDGLDPVDIMQKLKKNVQLETIKHKEVNDIIVQCRCRDPNKRPTFEWVMEKLSKIKRIW